MKKNKNNQSCKDLWDSIKCTSIHLTGVPGRKNRKEHKKLFEEIMAKNSPNLRKHANLHVQDAQWSPSRINSKKYTLKHGPVKLSKDNDRILQAARRELTPNSLLETVRLEAERWLLKCWKKKLSTKKSTSSKITPQKWERKKKTFPGK